MSSYQSGVKAPGPLESIEFATLCFYNHFYVNAGAQKPTSFQTITKITEELGELAATISKHKDKEKQEEEFGDVLVTAIMHGINSEYSLNRVSKYIIKKLEDRRTQCIVKDGMIIKKKDLQ